jgi:hypothetical protein
MHQEHKKQIPPNIRRVFLWETFVSDLSAHRALAQAPLALQPRLLGSALEPLLMLLNSTEKDKGSQENNVAIARTRMNTGDNAHSAYRGRSEGLAD